MTKKKNPEQVRDLADSPLRNAIREATPEAIASATGLALTTVKQWSASDRAPSKHLATVIRLSGYPALTLAAYVQDRRPIRRRKVPTEMVDALIDGTEHPDLPPIRRKQMLTLWGNRLPRLRQALDRLGKPFETVKDFSAAVSEEAEAIGVSPPYMRRLMTEFKVERAALKSSKKRKEKRENAEKHRKAVRNASVVALRGTKTGLKAAADAGVSYRTLHRHLEEVLTPYPGLTLKKFIKMPRQFRFLVAHEVEYSWPTAPSQRLLVLYQEYGPWARHYKKPADLIRAHIQDKLIAVLSGETSVRELHDRTGMPVHVMEELFEAQLVALGFHWVDVSRWSIHHQDFLSDIFRGAQYAQRQT